MKKMWKKSRIVTLSANELALQIKVAARSVGCIMMDFR